MPLVYTEHHCSRPSATLLPVWLDMADHKKNGGGSLKL